MSVNLRLLMLLDELGRKRLERLLAGGERFFVVGSPVDYFGDGVIWSCSKCGSPVFLRPYIAAAISEHDLVVRCPWCVDRRNLGGQVLVDLASIAQRMEDEE